MLFDALARSGDVEAAGHVLDLYGRVDGFRLRDSAKASDRATQTSRYLVALEDDDQKTLGRLMRLAHRCLKPVHYTHWYLSNQLGPGSQVFKLEGELIGDYLWQRLFQQSLPPERRSRVVAQDYFGSGLSWGFMNRALTLGLPRVKLDTTGWDIYLAQTPFSGRVSPRTKLVVRYHDAIPITHPHTIEGKAQHNRLHVKALQQNAKAAHFVCNSETTRNTLIELYPEVEERSTVIHCLVSDEYYPEPVPSVANIISSHIHQGALNVIGLESWREQISLLDRISDSLSGQYILAVGSLDPRKNFASLIGAWMQSVQRHQGLKLLLVASLGWDYDSLLEQYRHAIVHGEIVILSGVPNRMLRQLYSNALVTVCPSFAEGFDYPGIESMKCGTPVIASDIPVHRELYGEHAIYFDPYDIEELTNLLGGTKAIAESSDQQALIAHGKSFDGAQTIERWVGYLKELSEND